MDTQDGPSTSTQPKLSTPQRQRQKTAEVWDEDFEFPTITIPKVKAKEPEPASTNNLGAGHEGGVEAGASSEDEDWDLDVEELDTSPVAGSSRLPSPTTGKRKSPESLGLNQLTLGSPRASSSYSTDLPIPRSPTASGVYGSSSVLQLISNDPHQVKFEAQTSSKQRSRSGSVTASRNKLIKRHPSTSFIPLASSSSTDTLSKVPPLPISRSSHNVSRLDTGQKPIHRSKSGEQMPPPPIPLMSMATHHKTQSRQHQRTSSRPGSRQGEVRLSAIPLSPYNDQDRNMQYTKKPGFWKRLSQQPLMGEPKTSPGTCKFYPNKTEYV